MTKQFFDLLLPALKERLDLEARSIWIESHEKLVAALKDEFLKTCLSLASTLEVSESPTTNEIIIRIPLVAVKHK